jgi:hypothetical protein
MIDYKDGLTVKLWRFVIFLCAIFFLLVLFRMLYSNPIEFNDESILKWQLGKTVFETKEWALLLPRDAHEAHHELRWSVIIPQILVAAIFSGGYASYFVTPILFYSIFTVLCIAMYGRQFEAFLFGALSAVVISFEPMGHVMASQLNTGAFGLLYVIAAFWCLLLYLKRGGWEKIVACALFSFFAYGAHITYLVFWAVPVTFLVINRRDYKTAITFISCLCILYVFEICILSFISNGGVTGGRVERIWEVKQSGATRFRGGDLFQVGHFFTRWRLIPKYDFLIMIAFLVGCLSLIDYRVRKVVPPGIWLCFYGALFYGIAMSFPIIGWNPIRLALDLHSRYLAPFFPLATVFIVWLVFVFVGRWGRKAQGLVSVVLIICLAGIFFPGTTKIRCTEEVQDMKHYATLSSKVEVIYCKLFRYSQEQNIYPAPMAFIFRADSYYKNFNRDYLEGDVALFGGTRIGPFRDFIMAQHPDARFVETRNGWYSIDGKDKDRCVMELGQTDSPSDNYRDCGDKPMGREIFD